MGAGRGRPALFPGYSPPALQFLSQSQSGLKGLLTTCALYAARIGGWLLSLGCRVSPLPDLEIEKITRFDASHDSHWEAYLTGFAIHFERRADLLNYKYFDRSDTAHEAVLFKMNGIPVGYGVFRLSKHLPTGLLLGRIVDMVYAPSGGKSLVRKMVHYMTSALLSHHVDGLVCVAPTREVARALQCNGYVLSRPQHAIIKECDFSLNTLRRGFEHLWYISLGDSDLDNYW